MPSAEAAVVGGLIAEGSEASCDAGRPAPRNSASGAADPGRIGRTRRR